MPRVVRYTSPCILTKREGHFYTCLIAGERVTVPLTPGALTDLRTRINAAKAADRKAKRVQP